MDELTTTVRAARALDASAIARVYIDSWHDTYPGILPTSLLRAMSPKGQTARWCTTIAGGASERVLVAECQKYGVVGMTSLGAALDKALGYDGEVYTLYVAPDFFGLGVGSTLLRAAFGALHASGNSSCVIWAHAQNPARYFYEAMGGRLIAERCRPLMGSLVREIAFGWRGLKLDERHAASRDKTIRP
ncbi:MAG TPA: GNAT family N-acetyltransferase [Rhizomicrobium sp.]|nr:GNAT family N-acetyltransferase [Rhizomicrobium sp.]